MNAKSKWRWKPFIDALGIRLIDIKNKMDLEEEENEKLGQAVNKIGKFAPGEDSELVMILSSRDTRDAKNVKATVAKWMEYDEDAFDEDENEDEDEDEELEDEEEEDEPPARPTRKTASGRASQSSAITRPSASKAAGKTGAAAARTARGTSARPVRDGKRSTSTATKRRRPADDDDEPPF